MKSKNEKRTVNVFEVIAVLASVVICLWAGDQMPFPQQFIMVIPAIMMIYLTHKAWR